MCRNTIVALAIVLVDVDLAVVLELLQIAQNEMIIKSVDGVVILQADDLVPIFIKRPCTALRSRNASRPKHVH